MRTIASFFVTIALCASATLGADRDVSPLLESGDTVQAQSTDKLTRNTTLKGAYIIDVQPVADLSDGVNLTVGYKQALIRLEKGLHLHSGDIIMNSGRMDAVGGNITAGYTPTAGTYLLGGSFQQGTDAIINAGRASLTLTGFNKVALNGKIVIGRENGLIINRGADTAVGSATIGETAQIGIHAKLAQSLYEENKNGTYGNVHYVSHDGTVTQRYDSHHVTKIIHNGDSYGRTDSGSGDLHGPSITYNQSKIIQTALGFYTVATGEEVGASDSTTTPPTDYHFDSNDLYIVAGSRLVDLTQSLRASGSYGQNFMSNLSDMYGTGLADNSGFMEALWGINAYELQQSQTGTSYTHAVLTDESNLRGPGVFNRNALLDITYGFGSRSLAEMYTGIQVARVMAANESVVRQNIAGITGRLASVRDMLTAQGISPTDALAAPKFNAGSERVWVAGQGMWDKGRAQDGFEGYKYNAYGALVGIDGMMGPLTLGAAFAFSQGTYADHGMDYNNSKLKNYGINAYGSLNLTQHWGITAIAGYTFHDNRIRYGAGGNAIKQDFDGKSMYGEARLEYVWGDGNLQAVPYAGIGWTRTQADSHHASVDGVGNIIRFSRQRTQTPYLPLGIAANFDLPFKRGVLTLTGNLGYMYMFRKSDGAGTMTLGGLTWNDGNYTAVEYGLSRRGRGRHLFTAGAGARYATERWELGAKYDFYHRTKAETHRLIGFVGLNF